jgi:hypothetical protein
MYTNNLANNDVKQDSKVWINKCGPDTPRLSNIVSYFEPCAQKHNRDIFIGSPCIWTQSEWSLYEQRDPLPNSPRE